MWSSNWNRHEFVLGELERRVPGFDRSPPLSNSADCEREIDVYDIPDERLIVESVVPHWRSDVAQLSLVVEDALRRCQSSHYRELSAKTVMEGILRYRELRAIRVSMRRSRV
jgi:hypothetical protein